MKAMESMSYQERAVEIMSMFLEDYSREELRAFADAAYSSEKFDDPAVAPVRSLDAATHCLELWHGPTSAFKDMALQMLPHLLYASLKKTGEEKTACILVATSGDTGKAALEGFSGCGSHQDHGVLSQGRRVCDPETADGDPGRQQCQRVCCLGQL